MKYNLLFLEKTFQKIELIVDAIDRLNQVKNKAVSNGDYIWVQGNSEEEVMERLTSDLSNKEKKEILFRIRILFEKNVIFLYEYWEDVVEQDWSFFLEYLEAESRFQGDYNGFLGLNFNTIPIDTNKQVFDISSWYNFHRNFFVLNPPQKTVFSKSINPYFENLFFSKSVDEHLPSLHTDCKFIMKTILYHLEAINDVFFPVFQIYRKEGVNNVCRRVENEYKGKQVRIGCSADFAGKDELNLKIDYFDVEKKKTETILYCDAHTKMWEYWEYIEKGNNEDKGDRIYFCEPQDNFRHDENLKDKIVILRIGKHRS